MQLARIALAAVLSTLVFGASPAYALCALIVLNSGTLAASADGTRLGSGEAGGIASVVTVATTGSSTLTVSQPALMQSPAGFNSGGSLVEVAYSGIGLLSSANQSYTSSQTAVTIPQILSALPLTVHNRVTSASGFVSGTYQTRTVVTCS